MTTKDLLQLKKGDMFWESEYGITLEGTIISKPVKHRGGSLTFDALMSDGKTVGYGFSTEGTTAYNPDIHYMSEPHLDIVRKSQS